MNFLASCDTRYFFAQNSVMSFTCTFKPSWSSFWPYPF